MNIMNYPKLRGCIFIVTYGRSGSTLLQRIIQTIPGAEFYGENYNCLESCYRSYRRAFRTRYDFGKHALPQSHPWYGANRINPDRFAEKITNVFIEEILQPSVNVTWLGFKEIRYNLLGDEFHQYMDFLRNNFYNPQFIFNTRDANEVSNSGWWKDSPKEEVFELVKIMDQRFKAYSQENPEISFITRHEQTREDPTYLQQWFEQIGEPFAEEKVHNIMMEKLHH